MKKVFLFMSYFFVLITCGIAYSQQPNLPPQEPRTKIESFQKQTGTVVIKGYSEVGEVSGSGSVSIDAMVLIDASTGKKLRGILVEVKSSGRFANSSRSFIDYDEIDQLLKGIDYISKVKKDITRLDNYEAIYKTKGDFSVITFNSGDDLKVAIKCGYIGPAAAYLSLPQLAEIRALISQTKQKLDAVK